MEKIINTPDSKKYRYTEVSAHNRESHRNSKQNSLFFLTTFISTLFFSFFIQYDQNFDDPHLLSITNTIEFCVFKLNKLFHNLYIIGCYEF